MPSKPTILYINHSDEKCGVYQFGKNVGKAISKSTLYRILYVECTDVRSFRAVLKKEEPVCVIYNYHPSTLRWAKKNAAWVTIPQIAMIHEVYQSVADEANDFDFDFWIGADPTLLLKNPIVYKTGRLVPEYRNTSPIPQRITVGSFGFGTPQKGFEHIVKQVQDEFDEALIRFNIPFATYGDADGSRAKQIAATCRNQIVKPGIKLEISHDFLDEKALLNFLSQNTVNVFLYEQNKARGISSVIDYALAVERPIAVSESSMFRHVHATSPSITLPENTLRNIIDAGVEPLNKFRKEYTEENLIWEYDRILRDVLSKGKKRNTFNKLWKKFLARTIDTNKKPQYFSWAVHDDGQEKDAPHASFRTFQDIPLSETKGFNIILDNTARKIYQPVIDQMWQIVPAILKKKIPEANVQQAFVLDTAIKFARNYPHPKILAVGSYEDSAVAVLKKLGYDVTEADPVLNYDLHTYLTKPHARETAYDIVVSTSVIEHVPNDEEFCRDISDLMKEGGIAIITCDYNDQYKKGDKIPSVDHRWYTQKDIKERLLKVVPDCTLYDAPQWDCPHPDFVLVNKYTYTFASIVFKKNRR